VLKLFAYLRPYALTIIGALLLTFTSAITDLSLPALMSTIVDQGVARGNIPLIWRIGALMLAISLVGVFASVAGVFLASRSSMKFGRDLRSQVFKRVSSFSLREIDTFGTASLITRTTNDVTQVQQIVFIMQRMMVRAPLMAIGGIVMALTTEPKLSWILLAVIPLMALVILLLALRGIPLFREVQKKLDSLNRVFRENLAGIRVIRAFDRTAYETQRFDRANGDLTAITLRVNIIMASLFPFVMLMMNLTTIVIVWFGGLGMATGAIKVGSLMAFIQYTTQIMFSVVMLSVLFVMVPRASVSAARINEVLTVDPEIKDPPRGEKNLSGTGVVEFRHVNFSYGGSSEPVLRDISFTAKPGTITAIIGGTGAGKSTLINLIARFYDPSSGSVLVDGVDVRSMTQEDLRSRLALTTQRPILFSGTVADNLRFGHDDIPEEDLLQAATVAQALDFIQERPGGLGSTIDQGGLNLSGGQKQRLAIARALVKKPSVYLFDDSFSALDFKTDIKLRSALKKVTADATVIIVAQRVSTVRDADQILVLDEGQLAGVGRHGDLLRTCEVYREIVASQMSEEEAV